MTGFWPASASVGKPRLPSESTQSGAEAEFHREALEALPDFDDGEYPRPPCGICGTSSAPWDAEPPLIGPPWCRRSAAWSVIQNIKLRVAREKKIAAEIKAGFEYLRDNLNTMSGVEKSNALSWLTHHAKLGHFGQEEVDRFLKAGNDKETPSKYPDDTNDDNDADDTNDRDDPNDQGDTDDHKPPKKGKKKSKPVADDEEAEEGDNIDERDTSPDRHEPTGAHVALQPADYAASVKATAAAIVAAGKRARNGEAGVKLPPKGSMARAIIDAGKRRRGEIP